jgi:hypothetical protein
MRQPPMAAITTPLPLQEGSIDMQNLTLDSLEISRFRTFRHLEIAHLGRVNLITGKNNVGKSCLLEALWLYARRGSPALIAQLLEARDESARASTRAEADVEDQTLRIKYLFYGRADVRAPVRPIEIGPLNSPREQLTLVVGWYATQMGEGGRREFLPLRPDEYHTAENPSLCLRAQIGTQQPVITRLDWLLERRLPRPPEPKGIPCVYVSANGLEPLQIAALWDAVALTPLEEEVLKSLRIIAPEVERVNLVGDQENSRTRIPTAKIAGLDTPLPLRSLGEGLNRVFGLGLALVNAKDGFLLIDEIESGLHFTVHPSVWQLIFRVARQLNIQVVATSHSWDAIEGFQKAASEDPEEGVLVRLSRKGEDIIPTLFRKHELAVVTRDRIEVR